MKFYSDQQSKSQQRLRESAQQYFELKAHDYNADMLMFSRHKDKAEWVLHAANMLVTVDIPIRLGICFKTEKLQSFTFEIWTW